MMKKIISFLLAVSLLLLSACTNTLEGVGKDLEKIGESIQKNVERVTDKKD